MSIDSIRGSSPNPLAQDNGAEDKAKRQDARSAREFDFSTAPAVNATCPKPRTLALIAGGIALANAIWLPAGAVSFVVDHSIAAFVAVAALQTVMKRTRFVQHADFVTNTALACSIIVAVRWREHHVVAIDWASLWSRIVGQ